MILRLCPLLLLAFALSCAKPMSSVEPSTEAMNYIESYTSGSISAASDIRVRFEKPHPGADLDDLLEFSPSLKGKSSWDGRTLVFKPKAPLTRDTTYTATVNLKELGGDAPFTFSFFPIPQGYTFQSQGIELEGKPRLGQPITVRGRIITSDNASPEVVRQMLKVTGANVKTQWAHEDERVHTFTLTGLGRGEEDATLTLLVDGKPLDVDRTSKEVVTLPGVASFSLLSAKAIQSGSPHVELRFSDEIGTKQKLNGLITVEGAKKLRIETDKNVARVFSKNKFPLNTKVKVSASLKNAAGYRLGDKASIPITFSRLKPQVSFLGKGSIVPTGNGFIVPIETSNLKSVQVEAIEVRSKNIPQFLQVNTLEGSGQLQRVGRIVWRKTVSLGEESALRDAKTRHGLDLSELLKAHQNSMVRLRLKFTRDDILYACESDPKEVIPPKRYRMESDLDWDQATENSSWDSYGYDYQEMRSGRDNPCHPGFYHRYFNDELTAERNFLLSDLGLIAKQEKDGDTLVYVTDLRSARSLQGVDVDLMDFQQNVLASGKTNAKGMLTLKSPRVPFLVVAKHRGQKGYLRLDRGEALSTAHFDTAGAAVADGLKGVLYGERGVWRPGDDIFMTFVLQDRTGTLPSDHPILLSFKDPRGKLVSQEVRNSLQDGFATFTLRTKEEAPTGNYTVTARVGGASFSKVLKIESVVPNRLKIDLNSESARIQNGETFDAKLFSEWLHGAKAKSLKAKVDVSLVPKSTRFKKYETFSFDDPTRRTRNFQKEIFDKNLDADGNAKVSFKLDYKERPAGMMNAVFTSRVFEPSGAFSIDRNTIPFSPYPAYVGLRTPKGDKARGMLLTDTKHKVDIALLDGDGKAIDGDVRVRLYKINWRWWWAKGTETLTDYAGRSNYRPLADSVAKVKDGKGQWSFDIKYPQWGRYLVLAEDKEGKHRAGKIIYVDWPGWAGRAQKDNPGGATVLNLVSDKNKVNVGEKFTVTIPGAAKGRALVTLENGASVVESRWVEMDKEDKQVTFETTASMAPNVFVNVSLLQPHQARNNDLPMRLYGIIPVEVNDSATKLNPVITAPVEIKPNTTSKISVSEKDGRPMTYTLAVVDEGLLGLTRYQTPNLWKTFYAREALGIRTWDVFDDVSGAFRGDLQTLLAIGGDGSGKGKGKRRTSRFPPMVHFVGPFVLDKGATREHAIPIGPYVGRVRAMVVASSQQKAYGSTGKEIFVRAPLMVQATLPRLVRPGEEIALPVSLFSLADSSKTIELSVKTDERVEVVGDTTKNIVFKEMGDQTIPFKLKIKKRTGNTMIRVFAKSQSATAQHEINLSIDRPGNRISKTEAITLAPGESISRTIDAIGIPGSQMVSATFSTLPPINLDRHLERLVRYPHGCAEQTTSAAFPQIYLPALVELSPTQDADVRKHTAAAIEKLRGYQTLRGGFGYWPSNPEANDWTTSYIGHFLLEAKRAGFSVPPTMLSAWVDYQRESARVHRGSGHDLEQAYRLYTLALADAADTASMNRLREQSKLSNAARARLAAAYATMGQGTVATSLIEGVSDEVTTRHEHSGTFNSPIRDTAMLLETFVLTGDKERADRFAKTLAKGLSSNESLNTQATAYGLIAMSRYARSDSAKGITARYSSSASAEREIATDKRVVITSLNSEIKQQKVSGLKVKNVGENTLFVEFTASGLPEFGKEESYARGIKLNASAYLDQKGKRQPFNFDNTIPQGADLILEYSVRATDSSVENLALSSIVPAGFEIRNERLFPGGSRSAAFDYQDIRDASVETYLSLRKGEERTFEIRVNAAYAGRFYWPGAHVEAMYDERVQGHEAGRFITIGTP